MEAESLADVVASTDDLVERFRNSDVDQGAVHWDVYREEHTSWIEEQRAWLEACSFMDQSYHLANYYIEGPDALRVNADLGVHDFESLGPEDSPVAKQHPVCSPEGYIIGDPILFYLAEDEVVVTGNRGLAQKWIQYNIETGDYDAEVTDIYSPYGDDPPVDFRFEIQGPHADAVLGAVLDGPLPDVSFFGMDEISIDGTELFVLGHGMASVPGYEIFGPYERHDEIKDAILEAGAAYGVRQLGSKSYKTATLTTGWLPPGLPAVYDSEAMAGYREWLDADCIEATWSLGGSFESSELEDYYLDPVELGYGRFVDLDHDFVGRDAIADRIDDPDRKKVTFVWNDEDIVDVFASLFNEGEAYKFIDLPDIAQKWDMGHYDRVEVGGETAGVSMFAGYDYNQREMLSLGVVDASHADVGTEVTIVWGEENSEKARVESHRLKEIRATIAPAPYVRGREDL